MSLSKDIQALKDSLCSLCFRLLLLKIFARGHPWISFEKSLSDVSAVYYSNVNMEKFDLRLLWNFKISCKSKIKLFQIKISSDISDKHFSNDFEGWPLRIIKISKVGVFCYFFYFMKNTLFVGCFNKLTFFHLHY